MDKEENRINGDCLVIGLTNLMVPLIEIWKTELTSLVAQTVKHLPIMQETRAQSLGWEDLEKEMATHSWRIPWMEEPGGLQSTGSQRVGHD